MTFKSLRALLLLAPFFLAACVSDDAADDPLVITAE